ncbi:hypothetical protein A3I95_01815 [Candidatus Nomurabacteria bacterium RIFCSPLOWO2_02_FULL_44_12]|uniref:Uncharacterized protein n=1 Tax=Candidatus Nomurabacteria bacterium RIFCSPLOWO2_12_FULL_44_11 TaxID=1801796 RepID=A0A1F6Y6K7_9BACT|nr:MAG: hypothetical protein A3E95_01385 [Candidatus Nomurabacteria bacterium RIFCSPHIGHO2_12_FULL_44_22b]OGJ01955.1 MAG: hypothetical protein A3G53_01560 [Candidatus Nomurabacteria bacterium RIFCSPLOWO2_12_FULL_44_11]OGJ08612.1 MAG: hypothetical protein A3I95_01815 [Candidatus Nomurabacteria bacterium RIFCSPLOWO2_02_FULL_44_12]
METTPGSGQLPVNRKDAKGKPFSLEGTADAAKLLMELMLKYSGNIPLAVWQMMSSAERKLNQEISDYFKPPEELKTE